MSYAIGFICGVAFIVITDMIVEIVHIINNGDDRGGNDER